MNKYTVGKCLSPRRPSKSKTLDNVAAAFTLSLGTALGGFSAMLLVFSFFGK